MKTVLTRIVAAMALAAATFTAQALSFSVGNYKYYTNNDTEVTVDGFSSSAPSNKNYVDFPGTVTYSGKTYNVTTVGSYAFAYNLNLEEAIIPYGVTQIEESAFEGCTNLDAVRLPSSMQRLQSDCFADCTAGLYVYCAASMPPECIDGPFDGATLSRLIVRRDDATDTGVLSRYKSATGWKNFAQFDTKANAYDVVYDEGKTTACYYVISYNYNITVEGVTYNGEATVVGGGTQCKVADKLTLNGKSYAVRRIGDYAFSKDYSVNSGVKTLTGCKNVEFIDDHAFEGSSIESASFPILKLVYSSAFKNCTKLSSISLGDTYGKLEEIFDEAFAGCTALKSITFPRGYEGYFNIREKAFMGCSSLTSVEFYRNTHSLGDKAFAYCTSLSTVYVHAPDIMLGSNVFQYISGTTALHAPAAFYKSYKQRSQWKDFGIIYGDQDRVILNGETLEFWETEFEGVNYSAEKNMIVLDNANVDVKGYVYNFIKTNCPDLTIRLKGLNIIRTRGFLESECQHNATHGNVTICGEYEKGDTGLLFVSGTGTYTFDFSSGGNLTFKDISYLLEQNANCASFYGNGTPGSVLTINNCTGSFNREDKRGNVIAGMKNLTLVDAVLTNCTYSATATAYGSDTGSVQFETTKTTFSGDLYIAGTKVTNQNRKKDAIVEGVSVGVDGTITLDGVNYSNSSATFIKTGIYNQKIVLKGDNTVKTSVFLRAEAGDVTIEGGGTGSLSTTGSSSGVANFYFVGSGGGCTISNVKNFYNAATQYPFLGKSGSTVLTIENSSGEFKRTGSGNIAIGQIKKLVLVDTKLTNCNYSESATQYGNNGSVKFETTKTPSGGGNKYDVNGDGNVDVGDVNTVLGDILATGGTTAKYDVNGDGHVDVGDVNAILAEILSPSSGGDVETYTVGGVSFKMIKVKGGTFTMGATSEQGSEAGSSEKPTHQVTLSDYYIGEFEVTEALWNAVMGSNPSANAKGDKYPVENVSWNDCQTFVTKLNQMTGQKFRLPTEAEWEYAARGGSKSKGYKYAGSNTLNDVAWNKDNSSSAKHSVGGKTANELGLYDMSGNIFEWVQDYKGDYPSEAVTNPTGATESDRRVQRGGSFSYDTKYCRVSARSFPYPDKQYDDSGLRLAK